MIITEETRKRAAEEDVERREKRIRELEEREAIAAQIGDFGAATEAGKARRIEENAIRLARRI